MSSAELLGISGAGLSFILTICVALIGVVYRNDQRVYDASKNEMQTRLNALEQQNTNQETKIATLQAESSHTQRDGNRLLETLGNLDKTQNAILQELAQQRGVLSELSRRLTGQPMSAIKVPTR